MRKPEECAGCALTNEREEIALVEKIHRKVSRGGKADAFSTIWIPKGAIEDDETARAAAIRETIEEMRAKKKWMFVLKKIHAYDTFKVGSDGGRDVTDPKHIEVFGGVSIQREFRPTHPNHPRALWVPFANVKRYVKDDADRAAFDAFAPILSEISAELRKAMTTGRKNRKVFNLAA